MAKPWIQRGVAGALVGALLGTGAWGFIALTDNTGSRERPQPVPTTRRVVDSIQRTRSDLEQRWREMDEARRLVARDSQINSRYRILYGGEQEAAWLTVRFQLEIGDTSGALTSIRRLPSQEARSAVIRQIMLTLDVERRGDARVLADSLLTLFPQIESELQSRLLLLLAHQYIQAGDSARASMLLRDASLAWRTESRGNAVDLVSDARARSLSVQSAPQSISDTPFEGDVVDSILVTDNPLSPRLWWLPVILTPLGFACGAIFKPILEIVGLVMVGPALAKLLQDSDLMTAFQKRADKANG